MEIIGSKRSYALTWCMQNNDDDDDSSSTIFYSIFILVSTKTYRVNQVMPHIRHILKWSWSFQAAILLAF